MRAARLIAAAAAVDDDIPEGDSLLAMACLTAAAHTAHSLAAHASEAADLRRRLHDIELSDDLGDAGRTVWAISWYFALHFIFPISDRLDPDAWLIAMNVALGGATELHPLGNEEPRWLGDLYNAYIDHRDQQDPRFALAFARWVDRHLDVDEDDLYAEAPVTALLLMGVLPHTIAPFHSILIELGLVRA